VAVDETGGDVLKKKMEYTKKLKNQNWPNFGLACEQATILIESNMKTLS
jgi:hypothetical protein